jgi:citrate synthase
MLASRSILIHVVNMKTHLTAEEASAELGVTRATLYAYVSRGMIRSEPRPGARAKLYLAADVRALRERSGAAGAGAAVPPEIAMLDTATTAIHDGRQFYRGIDVAVLAESARLESVATLLWGADGASPFEERAAIAPAPALPGETSIVTRLLVALALGADSDLAGHARSPDGIARTGARIVTRLLETAAGESARGRDAHRHLAEAWGVPRAADLLRRALVVMADHELAASTFAVRVAASTGASPWRAIAAGLACLDGPRHGGAAARAAGLLAAVTAPENAELVVAERLRAGENVPGFGHPLYPDVDPRAAVLIAAARTLPDAEETLARADALIAAGHRLIARSPNLDLALAIACAAARLPTDAPITLFAIARSVGWIAHVIEQSRSSTLLRPRARYVGPTPR